MTRHGFVGTVKLFLINFVEGPVRTILTDAEGPVVDVPFVWAIAC